MKKTASEFRQDWEIKNPKIIHIPSSYELYLMEEYAKYYASQSLPPVSEEEMTAMTFISEKSRSIYKEDSDQDQLWYKQMHIFDVFLSRLPQRERHIPSDQEIRDMADNHARYGDGDQYLNDDQYEGFISGAAQMREIFTGIIISSDKPGSWREVEQPEGKKDIPVAEKRCYNCPYVGEDS